VVLAAAVAAGVLRVGFPHGDAVGQRHTERQVVT
jgi:hypothetical protein